jgi:hypothetical protein
VKKRSAEQDSGRDRDRSDDAEDERHTQPWVAHRLALESDQRKSPQPFGGREYQQELHDAHGHSIPEYQERWKQSAGRRQDIRAAAQKMRCDEQRAHNSHSNGKGTHGPDFKADAARDQQGV